MASEKEMYEIIGRSVADSKFRELMITNPEEAAGSLGYSLTPQQAASLKDSNLGTISEELQSRISKMGMSCGAAGAGAYGIII